MWNRHGLHLLAMFAIFNVLHAPYGPQACGQTAADAKQAKHTNRLARQASPYLLMHAHNPTDWFPWGPEAFAKAKKEGKLIFLSIGYSSCYWCHVMERESFNNEEVAKILNKQFVCIKVDREERPDIDQIYMTALTLFRSGGGWPLSMFLTAEGRPIFGGTYWPREDRQVEGAKVAGFKSILNFVADMHKNKPKDIESQAEKLGAATLAALERAVPGAAIIELNRDLVKETVDDLKETFDKEYGGFGSRTRLFKGPKFPTPPCLRFVLTEGERSKSKELIGMITFTLDKMAHGGIYDQLGGGFHRYSTERTWTVPHFEKMLYDNAQLVETYAIAYRLTKNPLYRRIIDETLAYVKREVTSPEGAFYSSQDAETHHEEGRFYVWTEAELREALPEKADLEFIRRVYGADGKPNFEEKYHIFTLPIPLDQTRKEMKLSEKAFEEKLTSLKQKLFDIRSKRDAPFLNKIALTAWSGQMMAGLAEAGQALNEPRYVKEAARTAEFVLAKHRGQDGRLFRTYGAAPGEKPRAAVNAYVEDYAFLVHGLLNLHQASNEKKWLDEAKALTETMTKNYEDSKGGGFYFTAHDHEKLFARSKDQYDGAQPSGNSVAARNLVRLWKMTGEDRYRTQAEKTIRAFAGSMKANAAGLCTMTEALALYLDAKSK